MLRQGTIIRANLVIIAIIMAMPVACLNNLKGCGFELDFRRKLNLTEIDSNFL